MTMKRLTKWLILALSIYVSVAGISVIIFNLSPLMFVKFNSFDFVNDTSSYQSVDLDVVIDPTELIKGIPYKNVRITEILPKERYEMTVTEGLGDCSNFSYGYAYRLNQIGADYSIVHLLRVPGYEAGKGHVTLEAPIDYGGNRLSAILDLFEGGVLSDGEKTLSSRDLYSQSHGEIRIVDFSELRDDKAPYYLQPNLDETVIGFTPKSEVLEYFKFIERIYLELGNSALEKYVYDGIALLAGKYPSIKVSEIHAEYLLKGNSARYWIAVCSLNILRLFILVVVIGMLLRAAHQLQLRFSYKSDLTVR